MPETHLVPKRTHGRQRHTVLIVDDYPDMLEVWGLYLRGQGLAVLTATDGEAAVALATQALPDLVVLDLELPGKSGIEVAEAIRAQPATRHIPIIVATGHSDLAEYESTRNAGFDAIVIKPCFPAFLLSEIRRLLPEPSS
jgi:CheY-like chemotaxis protein